MAQALKKHAVSDAPVIPDRLYFKIGDVARICGVETYVLRFWETQFPQLKPNKSGTGQRLYRRREVELALDIKRLVHSEGYTIAGAKQVLDTAPRSAAVKAQTQIQVQTQVQARISEAPKPQPVAAVVGFARAELRELLAMLSSPTPAVPAAAPRPRAKLLRVRPTESEPLFPL
jgi:DNA-binding transcriptional MerR regulator